MSALHWAAFNDDDLLTTNLLAHGAKITLSHHGHNPVDIAGLCRNGTIVETLTNHLIKICPTPSNEEIEAAMVEIADNNEENVNPVDHTPASTNQIAPSPDGEEKNEV